LTAWYLYFKEIGNFYLQGTETNTETIILDENDIDFISFHISMYLLW